MKIILFMRQWNYSVLCLLSLAFGFVLVACDRSPEKDQLFKLIKSSASGVTFSNNITESPEFNIINYQDFYSGGGVSIGDINNDGLPDLFFTGNMVQNRIYLNKGNLQFEDITEQAGLTETDYTWTTGSTMIDINNDGLLDIYVCYSGLVPPEQRRNKLWINQGDMTFKNEAAAYGLDHAGYAVNAHFFDYDRDGDLDVYIVNQGPEKNQNFNMTVSRAQPNEYAGDKLFRNDNGMFNDVTLEAGIYSPLINFGHGAAIGDLNNDGWEDIFVCNDFFEHDYLYINNGDGTFTENLKFSMQHISYFSMGNDLADFNNDGLLDIVVLDMVAEDDRRQKEMLAGMNSQMFWRAYYQGYHHQYMYNMLHLNLGDGTFSDIGHLAGISNTDWSWGPLFADFDGDGFKDLFVSNGLRKDIRNRDWAADFNEALREYGSYELFPSGVWQVLLGSLPSEKLPNYVYRNNGDLIFENVTSKWGLNQLSFSNGAAYGDLDNDGDLDLVVNNVDEPAFIYENQSNHGSGYRYLSFRISGPPKNLMGIGTKIILTASSGVQQLQQLYPARGYRSSMDPRLIFGCGADTIISKVEIIWPDLSVSELIDVQTNQELHLDYALIPRSDEKDRKMAKTKLFDSAHLLVGHPGSFRENFFNPYEVQPLLPYKLSELGPFIAVADVNGDGLDDLFVGGPKGIASMLFIQQGNGKLETSAQPVFENDRDFEDMGSVFIDADNDGDADLYVVSGGYELQENDQLLQDRLYLNDGKGNFTRAEHALPEIRNSGGRVVAEDYDMDGDIDLFITGRQVPGKYPMSTNSVLLRNDGGIFTDVTSSSAPEMLGLGMATDAVWTDFDRDGDLDLLVVGEWMPITLFVNENGVFKKAKFPSGLEKTGGWWYSIAAGDFDGDGDDDYVAGNLGWNYRYQTTPEYPFQVFSDDFNRDGTLDIVLARFNNNDLVPVENFERSKAQIPELENKINSHNEFARMNLGKVYGTEALKNALNLHAHTFASSYIENLGDGNFKLSPLPTRAQISNTNAILVSDFNNDGSPDILLAGNLYGSEEQTVRIDAGVGLLLTGNGQGAFEPMPPDVSGFYAGGDVKDMKFIRLGGEFFIAVSRNGGQPSLIKWPGKAP